jgi:hypothetical protein
MIEMVHYQLGKIYYIIDLDTNECYIGSTCEPTLAQRKLNTLQIIQPTQKALVAIAHHTALLGEKTTT